MYLMRWVELQKIGKLYFGIEDIARTLAITSRSARVTANRYTRQGILLRVKRNMYVLREKWASLDREQKFLFANIIQTPSYVSLMTALDYYEITTQMQRDAIESIAIKRTKSVAVQETIFNYTRLNPELYSGFTKRGGFFIAEPEKAFLDAVYLMSFGRYNLDLPSIDFSKLNRKRIAEMTRSFSRKTQRFLAKHEYF